MRVQTHYVDPGERTAPREIISSRRNAGALRAGRRIGGAERPFPEEAISPIGPCGPRGVSASRNGTSDSVRMAKRVPTTLRTPKVQTKVQWGKTCPRGQVLRASPRTPPHASMRAHMRMRDACMMPGDTGETGCTPPDHGAVPHWH